MGSKMTNKYFSEISLDKELSYRYIPAIFSVMVFLIIILIAVSVSIGGSFFKWDFEMKHRYTVQVPAAEMELIDALDDNGNPQETPLSFEKRAERAKEDAQLVLQQTITVFKSDPQVIRVDVVDAKKVKNLVRPFISTNAATLDSLPLPTLIEIDVRPGGKFNLNATLLKLKSIHENIQVDHQDKWQQSIKNFGQAIKLVSYVFISLIVLCLVALMILITKSAVHSNQKVIDVLRLMGARNNYIAHLYQMPILKSTLMGGFIGALLALPVIYGFSLLAKSIGLLSSESMAFSLSNNLTFIIATPLIIAFISFVTARITVMRSLNI